MFTGTRLYSPSSSSGILPPLAQLPERNPHLELREPPHRPVRAIAPPYRDDPHVLVRRQAVLPRLARDRQRPLALSSGAILLAHEEREEVAPSEAAHVFDELRRRLHRLAREIRPPDDDLPAREHLPLVDLDLRALDALHDHAVRRPLLLDVQTVLEPEPDAAFGARGHRVRERGVDVEREWHVGHFGAVVARAAAARDRRAADASGDALQGGPRRIGRRPRRVAHGLGCVRAVVVCGRS
ncbi:hypothetical protein C8Q76DRAFT_749800 [Earliella scabrosa]|nr:hypothetical protein C8Q76DRAFT_749800 [Earliella scabrosa]